MPTQSILQYLDKYPLNFRMYYGNYDAIYIDEGSAPTPWHIEVFNRSSKKIHLTKPADTSQASAANCHFQIELYTTIIKGLRDVDDGPVPGSALDTLPGWAISANKQAEPLYDVLPAQDGCACADCSRRWRQRPRVNVAEAER